MKKAKSILYIFLILTHLSTHTSEQKDNLPFYSATHPGYYIKQKERVKEIIKHALSIPGSEICRAITIDEKNINQCFSNNWLFKNPTKWFFVYAIFFAPDKNPFSKNTPCCYVTPQLSYQDTLEVTSDIHLQNVLRENTLRGINAKTPETINEIFVLQKIIHTKKT